MAKRKNRRTNAKNRVSTNSRISIKKDKRMPLAIIALLLNTLILPGFGTLVGGKFKTGIWQLALFIVGVLITGLLSWQMALVGVPVMIAAWIWGIISGINLIQRAR